MPQKFMVSAGGGAGLRLERGEQTLMPVLPRVLIFAPPLESPWQRPVSTIDG
jgi:hypothetical protein